MERKNLYLAFVIIFASFFQVFVILMIYHWLGWL